MIEKETGREGIIGPLGILIAWGNRMMIRIVLSLLMILTATLSFGETYQWTDERGGIHYTDEYTKVPERFRSNMKKIEEEKETTSIKKEGEIPEKGKEAPLKDRLGRGEEYWKTLVGELKNKIRALQEKNENLRLKYNELTQKHNNSKSSLERGNFRRERDQTKSEMDQIKVEIEELMIMLEKKIPEEAELFGAKPEWIR